MPLLPVSTSRTSTPLNLQRLLFQLNSNQVALQQRYDQLSTGRKLLRYSDDPAAANRAIALQNSIERSGQLLRNAGVTSSYYQNADEALGRVTGALTEARGVAVQAAQSVLSPEEREALAITIQQQISSIVSAGNATFLDHPLLGGVLGQRPTLEIDGPTVLYGGNVARGSTLVGPNDPVVLAANGNDALGAFSIILAGKSLDAALTRDTLLSDMRGGLGVEPGVIEISDGVDWQTVDMSKASTIGDVADLIEHIDLHGRELSVSIQNDAIRIEYLDGLPGTLAIRDTNGSRLATDLAINNEDGLRVPPIIGDRLAPQVTLHTRLATLNSGAGIDVSSGIRIQQGDQVFVIDLSRAQTLGDVIAAINRSEADVHAEVNGIEGHIALHSLRSGVNYSIGENGGNVAAILGIRSSSAETKLSELGNGSGVAFDPIEADLRIVRPDGVVFDVNLDGSTTIQDVIDRIRNHPLNLDTLKVLVDLNEFGNGIQLKAPPGTGDLTVEQLGLSDAGVKLGLIPAGQTVATSVVDGSVVTIAGSDYRSLEAGGTIDTLIRLEQAVRNNDIQEISRLQGRLGEDLDRASQTRGRVGVWSQSLDQLKTSVEDQLVTLEARRSDEVDADLAKIISELTQRQTSLEASMRLIGQLSQLTVLNFL
jgi:flagellar hook-associated protein 3 FlgL